MKKLIASLVLVMGTILSATPASAAIVVSFSPSSQHVNVGDVVTVDVNISGLGGEILSAYDVNVLFNSTVLGGFQSISMNSAEFGGLPDLYFSGSFDTGNNGSIGGSLLLDDDLAAIQTDDTFTFLTFGFTALLDGVSSLTFGPDPDFERNVVGRDFLTLDASFGSACIAVGSGVCNTVPEPASYSLFGLALAGAFLPGALRRLRQARGAA